MIALRRKEICGTLWKLFSSTRRVRGGRFRKNFQSLWKKHYRKTSGSMDAGRPGFDRLRQEAASFVRERAHRERGGEQAPELLEKSRKYLWGSNAEG